ncbi:restriction endonuclease [Candidatus Nomurabacteria bacterium]|uniref:Restriction endonuclease n=1 Tax=candidate division WWE3 bacterium TaxID=2053526 RepID=A0A955IWR3_UNCKA|nr:restriction endonuclease [candidate division WWE3 bacterium]MCB9824068.1 restriction endonuclease [Candidatus Nomurabacteria bacterium]MCB9826961.1 restriction endonuclease [Candidatus Nomurabacteria bacterium]MCB9828009.1 restriction endonuclease [Candidatus Nomurabacteria bacterium]HXK52716.1 restriction endonuclease [bacterium]
MSIPTFDETFLPILNILSKGETLKTSDLPSLLLEDGHFSLSEEEQKKKISSGSNMFSNRVYWGVTYLRQAKLVERPSRGFVKITQKGSDYLATNPSELTLSWIKQDSDYQAYEPVRSKQKDEEESFDIGGMSPQDLIDQGVRKLNEQLKNDLIEKLHESNPYYFEKIVLILFKKMGYGDFQETPKSGDGGIDGIINNDLLGLEKIYIQAKRYAETNKVREPEIRNFIGAMSGDVSRGIFVTTSEFDDSAKQKARDAHNHKIILIDGDRLTDLMIEYNVGVQVQASFDVKDVDEDFFELG